MLQDLMNKKIKLLFLNQQTFEKKNTNKIVDYREWKRKTENSKLHK